ncbi:MAG: hypothetical protein V9G11_04790, partial [Bifidobacterium adolescentis]
LLSQNFPVDHQGGDHVTVGGVRPTSCRSEMRSRGWSVHSAAPLDAVKDRFFGTADRNAREFAFRYVVLGDFLGYDQQIKDPKWGPAAMQVTAMSGQRAVSPADEQGDAREPGGSRECAMVRVPGRAGVRAGATDRRGAGLWPAPMRIRPSRSSRVDLEGAMPSPGAQAGNHIVFLGSGMTGDRRSPFP